LKRKKNIYLKNSNIKKFQIRIRNKFFFIFFNAKVIIMSKRYSGKSFKDSSVSKKPKLNLKEKRKKKKEKAKKS